MRYAYAGGCHYRNDIIELNVCNATNSTCGVDIEALKQLVCTCFLIVYNFLAVISL